MRGTIHFSAILVLVALLLVGCATQAPKRTEEPPDADKPLLQQEELSRSTLDKQEYVNLYAGGVDDWREPWQPNIAPPARFDLMAGREEGRVVEVEEQDLRQMQGFRIQLADVLTLEDANAAKDAALKKFTHVYVTYRSPNYKIRAGNYKKRGDAEQALPLARECGFRSAWIVPDWVYVNPPAPAVTDSLAAADSLLVE